MSRTTRRSSRHAAGSNLQPMLQSNMHSEPINQVRRAEPLGENYAHDGQTVSLTVSVWATNATGFVKTLAIWLKWQKLM